MNLSVPPPLASPSGSQASWADEVASRVSAALREELALYPKPGLVSPIDCGSHPDMRAETFLDSIRTLEPYFGEFARAGSRGVDLPALQHIGLAAETAMLETTQGRNTHRGAIFCLGLLASAAGWRWKHGARENLGLIVAARWGSQIPRAQSLPTEPTTSHGLSVCRNFQVRGVRGEAADGFPTVFNKALPVFRTALSRTDRAHAALRTFFAIMAEAEDTTLLHRGGEVAWDFARRAARDCLDLPDGLLMQEALRLHEYFVARNWTAGGTADLLSATLFADGEDTCLA